MKGSNMGHNSIEQQNKWRLIVAMATLGISTCLLGPRAWARPSAPKAAAQSQNQNESDRVDISNIEKKYWAPKDTDFSVVQNRKYKKAHRLGLTAAYGIIVNDPYTNASEFGLLSNYYFTERYGVQLTLLKTNASPNDATNYFSNFNKFEPNYSEQTMFYGASFNWVPVYAKMSLLDSKIMYFDLAISPGFGITNYTQQISSAAGGDRGKSAFTYTFDVTEHFFINNHWALRFDFMNRWFNEERADYNKGTLTSTAQTHTAVLMFGATYYLP